MAMQPIPTFADREGNVVLFRKVTNVPGFTHRVIVNQVATNAGGFVDIESELGQGTAVRVYLPKIAEAD